MTRSDPGAVHLHSVGCTAEIRQISRQEDGMLNIVAKGMPQLEANLLMIVVKASFLCLIPTLCLDLETQVWCFWKLLHAAEA